MFASRRSKRSVQSHTLPCARPVLLRLTPQVIIRALVFLYTTGRSVTQHFSPGGRASSLRGVQPGRLPHTLVDLSDPQWRSFRQVLPLLCIVAVATAVAARLVRAYNTQASKRPCVD